MRKYKRLFFSLLFCAITFAMLYGTANILRDRETTLSSFYSEPSGSVDMIIVGSSHVNNGVIPNVFWQESERSACNVYSWAQPMWTAYHYIIEAFSEQDVELVVLDMYGMTYGNSYMVPQEIDRVNYQTSFNIDMNLNYLSLIQTAEHVGIDLRPYEEFLNLPRYHARWKNLDARMLTYDPHNAKDFLKGYGISYQSVPQQQPSFAVTEPYVPYEYCVEYLDKIVQLCEKKNVDLIFTMVPYIYNETEAGIDLWIEQYAAEHGIPYISYIGNSADAIELDYSTDFQDNAHLNYYGAQKVSTHLAQFVKQRYPDYQKQQNPHCEQLDEDYQKYQRILLANDVMVESDLQTYLTMVLQDENYLLYLANNEPALAPVLSKAWQGYGEQPNNIEQFCGVISKQQADFDQTLLDVQLFGEKGTVSFDLNDENVIIKLNDTAVISQESTFKAVLYDTILDRPLETVAFDAQTGTLLHKEFSSDIIDLFKK